MSFNRFPVWRSHDRSNSALDLLWVSVFLLAALVLFCLDLGGVALRDWDEGTVAQVARELSRSHHWQDWLYPRLWGEPYLNKPPLVHSAIALLYRGWGIQEWTARLPGALLSAFSVPLLYGLGRTLFVVRLPAVFSTMVYLTLLPVVRHGRLAMLDGAVVCFFLVLLIGVLRSRHDRRWSWVIGIAFSLIGLTKGILALLLLAIALCFLAWDTPRLLRSPPFWTGLGLGSLPLAAWYFAQLHHYGQAFWQIGIQNQGFDRVWETVENNSGPPWYYLLELLKYSWPWLIFCPWGLGQMWHDRAFSWGKLLLVWLGGYLAVISGMGTKLPWYVFPLYPGLALVVGMALATTWNRSGGLGTQPYTPEPLPVFWVGSLAFLTTLAAIGSFYFSPGGIEPSLAGQGALILLTLTFSFSTLLAHTHNAQFITVLAWGLYVSFLVFMTSNFWLWELGEDYPVKPIATLIQTHVPPKQPLYIVHPYERPSLNFYSDRRVLTQAPEELQIRCQQSDSLYFLIQNSILNSLPPVWTIQTSQIVGQVDSWSLVYCDRHPTFQPPSESDRAPEINQ